jgi:hypothetical protein
MYILKLTWQVFAEIGSNKSGLGPTPFDFWKCHHIYQTFDVFFLLEINTWFIFIWYFPSCTNITFEFN